MTTPLGAHEPELSTPADLLGVLAVLSGLEPLFSGSNRPASREEYDRRTDPGFWEVGASGRRYSRDFCWRIVAERGGGGDVGALSDVRCQAAGPGTYLLTYTLARPDGVTRRLTVWQRRGDDWVALFHQGTPAPDGGSA